MKEKDYQTIFNHWLKNVYKRTGAFELKLCRGKSLPFSAVAPHQVAALLHASNDGLVYKIPDCGYQNPFDCVSLYQVPAFVVIKFKDSFELIDIHDFLLERDGGKRKSLTYERAKKIATISIKI